MPGGAMCSFFGFCSLLGMGKPAPIETAVEEPTAEEPAAEEPAAEEPAVEE